MGAIVIRQKQIIYSSPWMAMTRLLAMVLAIVISGGTAAFWLHITRRKLAGDTGDTLGAAQVIAATACMIGVVAWV